jgi:hypothetical protein
MPQVAMERPEMITPVIAPQEPLPTKSVVHVSADREVREVPNGGAYGERTQKA